MGLPGLSSPAERTGLPELAGLIGLPEPSSQPELTGQPEFPELAGLIGQSELGQTAGLSEMADIPPAGLVLGLAAVAPESLPGSGWQPGVSSRRQLGSQRGPGEWAPTERVRTPLSVLVLRLVERVREPARALSPAAVATAQPTVGHQAAGKQTAR